MATTQLWEHVQPQIFSQYVRWLSAMIPANSPALGRISNHFICHNSHYYKMKILWGMLVAANEWGNPGSALPRRAYLLYWSISYSVRVIIVVNDVQILDSISCHWPTELDVKGSFPSTFGENGEVCRLPIFHT